MSNVILPQDFAECQNTVIILQPAYIDLAGGCEEAVVGVVKQKPELCAAPAQESDPTHQLGLVPFMDDHGVHAVQRPFHAGKTRRIKNGPEVTEAPVEFESRPGAVPADEILKAPTVLGFENSHLMSPADQLGGDSPQEMSVAVVPIGDNRMVEKRYPHYCS